MPTYPTETAPLWPLAVYAATVLVVIVGMMVLSYVLGQRRRRTAAVPYESGTPSVGSARLRLPVRFYLMAMFFVIFDLEAVFLVVWAVAAREVGWAGYVEMLVFVAVLLAALAYLWREGALDWAARPRGIAGAVPEGQPGQPVGAVEVQSQPRERARDAVVAE